KRPRLRFWRGPAPQLGNLGRRSLFQGLRHEVHEEAVDEQRLARPPRTDDEMEAPAGDGFGLAIPAYFWRERVLAMPVGVYGSVVRAAFYVPEHRMEREVVLA